MCSVALVTVRTSERCYMVSPMQGAERRSMGFRSSVVPLQSGLEEGEQGYIPVTLTMFALFEAGIQDIRSIRNPTFRLRLTWG